MGAQQSPLAGAKLLHSDARCSITARTVAQLIGERTPRGCVVQRHRIGAQPHGVLDALRIMDELEWRHLAGRIGQRGRVQRIKGCKGASIIAQAQHRLSAHAHGSKVRRIQPKVCVVRGQR